MFPRTLVERRLAVQRKRLAWIDDLINGEIAKPFRKRNEQLLLFCGVERRVCLCVLKELESLNAECDSSEAAQGDVVASASIVRTSPPEGL